MSSGTEYHANEHQMHSLNVIVGQKGGVIPSEVSNALAAYQVADAANDQAAMDKAFNDAVEANKKNGAAWSDVQDWHDEIRHQPHNTQLPGDPVQYRVYDSDLDILNYIVGNYGGPIPSEVSDALAAGDIDAAIEANKKNGAAWGAVQRWHNQIVVHAPIGDELPPPGGYPTGGVWKTPLGKYETTEWAPVAPEELLFTQATHDGRISSAEGSGGRRVWGTVGDAVATIPFPLDEGCTSSGAGASGLIDIKAGQWFTSYFEPDGYGQPSKMRCSTSK